MRVARSYGGVLILLAIVVMSFLWPIIAGPDASDQRLVMAFLTPIEHPPLGTDQLGRDLATQVAYGTRTTLAVALGTTLIAATVGIGFGVLGAMRRGDLTESMILRSVDVVLALPGLILALALAAVLGAGVMAVVVALIVRGIPPFVRVAHSASLQVLNQEYVHAARGLGARDRYVFRRSILPAAVARSRSLFPITVGSGVLVAASLSFFGLGVQPPRRELGLLISEGARFIGSDPHLLWIPGLVLVFMNGALAVVSAQLGDRRAVSYRGELSDSRTPASTGT